MSSLLHRVVEIDLPCLTHRSSKIGYVSDEAPGVVKVFANLVTDRPSCSSPSWGDSHYIATKHVRPILFRPEGFPDDHLRHLPLGPKVTERHPEEIVYNIKNNCQVENGILPQWMFASHYKLEGRIVRVIRPDAPLSNEWETYTKPNYPSKYARLIGRVPIFDGGYRFLVEYPHHETGEWLKFTVNDLFLRPVMIVTKHGKRLLLQEGDSVKYADEDGIWTNIITNSHYLEGNGGTGSLILFKGNPPNNEISIMGYGLGNSWFTENYDPKDQWVFDNIKRHEFQPGHLVINKNNYLLLISEVKGNKLYFQNAHGYELANEVKRVYFGFDAYGYEQLANEVKQVGCGSVKKTYGSFTDTKPHYSQDSWESVAKYYHARGERLIIIDPCGPEITATISPLWPAASWLKFDLPKWFLDKLAEFKP